ncbi:MAG: hypothetical protein U1D67_03090, partial [Dehalococcoidia bacterium]|nr:hypothetical protein [Dehalococcoidia bacterium]
MTRSEKLEFLYLAPYYLQAFFFLVGTFAWLLSETVFGARLPFWTSIWGWSLVLTNLLAMPLVNAVGLFLEESEEKDYLGLLSFIALCYIVVPFQAYAAVKGFIESSEGPWFRTPKTGLVTDVFARGRVYRWLTGFLSWKPATGGIAHARLAEAPVFEAPFGRYLALATANNQFNRLRMRPKQIRGLANLVIVCLVLVSVVLSFVAIPMGTTLAFDGLFYFRPRGADVVDTTAATPRRQMSTGSVGTSTGSVTLGAGADVGNTAYFHDTQAGSVSIPTAVNATASAAATDATLYGSQRHLHRDKQGNMILIFINSSGDIRGSFKTASSSAVWTPVDLELETHSSTYTNTSVSSALDNKGNIHMAYEASNGTGTSIYFKRVAVGRDSNGVVQRTGWSVGTEVSLAGAAGTNTYINPSLAIDKNGWPAVIWSKADSANSKRSSGLNFSRSCSDDASSTANNWEATTGDCSSVAAGVGTDLISYGGKNETYTGVLARMPGTGALYAIYTENNADDINIIKATVTGNDYNAWAAVTSPSLSIGTYSTAAPFSLSVAQDWQNNALIYAFANASNYTAIRKITSADSDADLSSPATTIWGHSFSLYASGNNTTNITYYLVYNQYSG